MEKPKKEYSDYKKFCEKHIQENENVITWGTGYVGEMMGSGDKRQYNGCLIVTDQRSVFYSKGMFSEVFEEIAHTKVSSIDSKKVLGHTTLTIHTSGNDLCFKSLVPDEAKDLQQAINQLKGQGNSSNAHLAGDDSSNPLKDIEKLAELRDKGILTEEEFSTKKAELLKKVA